MIKATLTLLFFSMLVLSPLASSAEELEQDPAADPQVASTEKVEVMEDDRSIVGSILMYLPNRVFDLLDIVRARVRIGPGISSGFRVTRPVSANLGAYSTIFVGLPGPRGEAEINWPFGTELYSGAQLSLASVETLSHGPDYGATEIGADLQILLVGIAVGIDPVEIVDFVLGFVGVDLQDDDV